MKKFTSTLLGLLLSSLLCMAESSQNTNHSETEHHNRYELEISLNNEMHSEFTGSLYFLPKKKFQFTSEDTFHHFASVLVQEIPFRNSKWGTFAGIGATYGFEKHTDHTTHKEVTEHDWSAIVQSGLAYALNKHWSTGFTFSPGWDFTKKEVATGLTFDIVYGF